MSAPQKKRFYTPGPTLFAGVKLKKETSARYGKQKLTLLRAKKAQLIQSLPQR